MIGRDYTIGDRLTFHRHSDDRYVDFVVTSVNINEEYYMGDWYHQGQRTDANDKFGFVDIEKIKSGQRGSWRLTRVIKKVQLPDELFAI